MRLRNVKNANEILENSKYYIKDPYKLKNNWSKVFPNNQELHLEIGCGKGNFLINMAKTYPNYNFIGIEKYASVLVRAIEKADQENITNICFLCIDAKNINEVFESEITTLYLNFSDPWPKTRHSKRRLTSPYFLKLYDDIFKSDAHIIQKTDNTGLFAFSLETISQHGYTFSKVSLDLANSDIPNVPTEYEEKFTKLGYKINYLDAIKKQNK